MKIIEVMHKLSRLFHGTTSSLANEIYNQGFFPPSYFTDNYEDAEEYAAMGGEENLQNREEQFEKEHGILARDYFGPDIFDMYKHLYPKNEHPVVIEIELPNKILNIGKFDAGASNALVFDTQIPKKYIKNIHNVKWDD